MASPTVVTLKRLGQHRAVVVRGRWNTGRCPVCEGTTLFLRLDGHPRNGYRCVRCWSVPRWRVLIAVMVERFPDWRDARIHEFGPSPESVRWFEQRCPGYSSSQYWPDVEPGGHRDGVRCEDLGALTLADGSIDLAISQDVFEHLPDPVTAATEIGRVLTPGGAHLFTVPIYPAPTVVRAELGPDGEVVHHLPPSFHGDPACADGVLVFRDWGSDIVDLLQAEAGAVTERIVIEDCARGITGGWHDVLLSRYPA